LALIAADFSALALIIASCLAISAKTS